MLYNRDHLRKSFNEDFIDGLSQFYFGLDYDTWSQGVSLYAVLIVVLMSSGNSSQSACLLMGSLLQKRRHSINFGIAWIITETLSFIDLVVCSSKESCLRYRVLFSLNSYCL